MSIKPVSVDPSQGLGGIPGAGTETLSPRELDVVRMVTNCYSNEDIARELYLSINSVKTYIRGAYRKIGATNRCQAVVWGVRHGMLEPLETPAPRRLSSVG